MENNEKIKYNWLMDRNELYTERYMEAENFLVELSKMKWYQFIFSYRKIIKFLDSRKKYDF